MERFRLGMMLSSKEQVVFFDGSISTPFPKITKSLSRVVKNVDQWLMQNAIAVAAKNRDELVELGLRSGEKKPTPAAKDLAEAYLASGLKRNG